MGKPSRLNAAWHRKHRMPKNATLDQRVAWHLAHAAACACRELPRTIREALSKRRVGRRTRGSRARP